METFWTLVGSGLLVLMLVVLVAIYASRYERASKRCRYKEASTPYTEAESLSQYGETQPYFAYDTSGDGGVMGFAPPL